MAIFQVESQFTRFISCQMNMVTCVLSTHAAGYKFSTAAKPSIGTCKNLNNISQQHFLSLSANSWSSPSYNSTESIKWGCPRANCYTHCPCHWYGASQLPVAVEAASWRWAGEKWRMATMWQGVVRWHYIKNSQCSEVEWRKLPVCYHQLCW